jgi:hypothetical protein
MNTEMIVWFPWEKEFLEPMSNYLPTKFGMKEHLHAVSYTAANFTLLSRVFVCVWMCVVNWQSFVSDNKRVYVTTFKMFCGGLEPLSLGVHWTPLTERAGNEFCSISH